MNESRMVLVESARIARGEIKDLKDVKAAELDALIVPGGFGSAKNLSDFAFKGSGGEVNSDVKRLINDMVDGKQTHRRPLHSPRHCWDGIKRQVT